MVKNLKNPPDKEALTLILGSDAAMNTVSPKTETLNNTPNSMNLVVPWLYPQ
jgi:hypothetical protein